METEFVKAIYPYSGAGQAVPLSFSESSIVLVVERTKDGWCRGFSGGKEGWFPTSYVKPLANSLLLQRGIEPSSLAPVLYSSEWTVYGTDEDKIYYVNTDSQATTWNLPTVSPTSAESTDSPPSPGTPTTPIAADPSSGQLLKAPVETSKHHQKLKKPKYKLVNGLTFLENGPEQPLLYPNATSYVDHFWGDNGEQTGFDVILEKHLNGKNAMKDMIDFFRERSVVEEHYGKSLMKLSKSTLGDSEQGSVGRAWQTLKAELRYRSEAHSRFAEQLQKEMEKKLLEYKESQKKERKEHQQIMEKSRKQIQYYDTNIEKARILFSGKQKMKKQTSSGSEIPLSTGFNLVGLGRRKSNVTTGDDLKKLGESYNQAQKQWIDNMINACQVYERHEHERSDFLKGHFLGYLDLCVQVDEASAESLSKVTDAIDRIDKKGDREFFIKRHGTGSLRPVDRIIDI